MFKNKTVEEKKAFKDKVMIGTAGVIVGIGFGMVMAKRDAVGNFNTMVGLININNSTNINLGDLIKRGNAGYITMCNETGERWASINEAAKATGISASLIARQMKGLIPHAKGMTFTNEGEFPTT